MAEFWLKFDIPVAGAMNDIPEVVFSRTLRSPPGPSLESPARADRTHRGHARDDALDAILQLAAVIDSATQKALIPRERGDHGAAMLMIIRDYIKPLPVGPRGDDTDGVGDDLTALVGHLRRLGGESGVQG